ncbi:putative transposase [Nocardia neocaledoniensis]|uniref:Putative transposase n=2 Tax=Nocardia neocaledoniensis TaxID=236511 RepID=A0A317NQX0_9NOCA|nr:putative transposase [Nocardia neocaledoniensis]
MEQRIAERSYGLGEGQLTPLQGWSLAALRKTWNQRKGGCAPWWPENSKEAYNTGLDELARALHAWTTSRAGTRAGARVGFPRHKRKARTGLSVRFTTGTIRIEPDRHHITLPRLGTLHTLESTRKLARRIEAGTARVLSATARFDGRRWWCAFAVIVAGKQRPAHVRRASPRCSTVGVDVGVKDLIVAATGDGVEVARVGALKPLTAASTRLSVLQRRAARRQGRWKPHTRQRQTPSKRWLRTQAQIGKTHARVANLRAEHLHAITTRLAREHAVIVVEDLNVAGLTRAGGARKRGLNRAIADTALARIRRLLAYKTRWYGSELVVADRWFPSSKTCSGCGGRKPNLPLAARTYSCDMCGMQVDRDLNAAINLARLGATAHQGRGSGTGTGSGPAADHRVGQGRGASRKTRLTDTVGKAGGVEASTPHHQPVGQTGTASP